MPRGKLCHDRGLERDRVLILDDWRCFCKFDEASRLVGSSEMGIKEPNTSTSLVFD